MKILHLLRLALAGLVFMPLAPAFAAAPPVAQVSDSDTPSIVSVRGAMVKVRVPAGFDRVALERRTVVRSRPWVQLFTQSLDGRAQEVTFRMRGPFPKHLLRVVGHRLEQVPAQFLGGPSEFEADPTSSGTVGTGELLSISSGSAIAYASANATNSLSLENKDSITAAPRDVVESDIWKIQGDRLYVFNYYRGLQSIDISNPAQPALIGTHYLPAAGDNLYLINEQYAALLTRTSGNFTWNNQPVAIADGSVVICDLRNGAPKAVASLPVEGYFVESRMVGTALYVATQVYLYDENYYGRSEIRVTGFDLSDPAHPVRRNTVMIEPPKENSYSYVGAVQASDHYFMVAENVYRWDGSTTDYQSRLALIDISSPDGTVKLRGKVAVEGFVSDKFKMREKDGVVSVIADHQSWGAGRIARHTHLENFSVANPDKPVSLGELDLGLNESVRGTRFDGDRVYVVTFLQIDPLWIVDNSDPSSPKITSHLEVPGFSTYIEPLGDRLVTIGFVNNRVSVSLFDVADAANPKVLSQLPVSEQWVYSEATWNEKAFTVLPEDGLIMVPVSAGWYYNANPAANASGIQLVDLGRDELKLRGRITQGFTPRRSTVHKKTVLALGNASLLSADITDRDLPVVVSDLELAWRADYAWRVGKYLLQLGGAAEGGGNVIAVTPPSNPDGTLNTFTLGDETVLAADCRDGFLYVAQRELSHWALNDKGEYEIREGSLKLGIYNVGSLPQIVKVSEKSFGEVPKLGAGAQILWPVPGTLVLAGNTAYPYWDGWYPIYRIGSPILLTPTVTFAAATTDTLSTSATPSASVTKSTGGTLSLATNSIIGGGYYGLPYFRAYAPEQQLIAFDVTQPKEPLVRGVTTLKPKFSASFSSPFTGGGKIYLSHQYGWYYAITLSGSSQGAEEGVDEATAKKLVGRHFLDVVDYTEGNEPVLRAPVSAPGVLQGLARDGQILFTTGPDYDKNGKVQRVPYVLHASAYDGAKVQLAASYPLGPYGAQVLPVDDRVLLFLTKETSVANAYGHYAQVVKFGDDAQFRLLGETLYSGSADRVFGNVLLGNNYFGNGSVLQALDFSNPAEMKKLGYFSIGGLYPDYRKAVGSAEEGFWLPVGSYGVLRVELPK